MRTRLTETRRNMLARLSEISSTHEIDAMAGMYRWRWRTIHDLDALGFITRVGQNGEYLRRTPAGTEALNQWVEKRIAKLEAM